MMTIRYWSDWECKCKLCLQAWLNECCFWVFVLLPWGTIPRDLCDWLIFRSSCAITHRHKTNLRVLQEMLPDDLLSYCQHHGLLDSILVGDNDDDGPSYASTSPEFMVSSVGGRLPSPQESGWWCSRMMDHDPMHECMLYARTHTHYLFYREPCCSVIYFYLFYLITMEEMGMAWFVDGWMDGAITHGTAIEGIIYLESTPSLAIFF